MDSIIPVLIIIMVSLYVLGAVLALILNRRPKLANVIPNIITSAAAITGIGTMVGHLLTRTDRFYLGNLITSIPYISLEISLDRLGAFFILTLSILALCVSLYSFGYLKHYYRQGNIGLFNFLFNTFILSMFGVFTSGNAVAFLLTWELMSVLSYFLVIYEADEAGNQKAGIIYLIMTHLATAFLFIAFGLIYQYTGSLSIGPLPAGIPVWVKHTLFICFLIGFGTKAGIIPLHIWLPYAHPAAPSNVSALMSGIMIKTAIYGLIRFIFSSLGAEYQWWGATILIIGAVSTILGVAYALMEHNIKRLLAYHSIENIGIILLGLGVSVMAYASGNITLSALALLASLFHLLNHTVFKGALFLGAGAVHYSVHTKDLEEMGGLLKKMPYTGLFFLIACLSISAIPPFNGFVSEWLTYQALFYNLITASIGIKVIAILSVAALAMAGALAAACFVKFFGIAFLGLPRSTEAEKAREVPATMLWGMGLLAGICLLLGVLPALAVTLIDKVTLSVTGASLAGELRGASSFIYYPLTVTRNTITPLLVLILGIVLLAILWLLVRALGRGVRERKYGTWDCGFTGLNSRMQYSATGFTKPLRIVFRALYRPTRELEIEEGSSKYFYKSMKYVVATEPIFEKYLYRPVSGSLTNFAKKFRLTVQTGSIHRYLMYIFVTVLLLLLYYRCCG